MEMSNRYGWTLLQLRLCRNDEFVARWNWLTTFVVCRFSRTSLELCCCDTSMKQKFDHRFHSAGIARNPKRLWLSLIRVELMLPVLRRSCVS